MLSVEAIVGEALETGRAFTLSYVLDFDEKKGELSLLTVGGREEFEVEYQGYSELARRVQGVVEQRFGALSYMGGSLREETKGNEKVSVHFDPGWGSFQIHVTPR